MRTIIFLILITFISSCSNCSSNSNEYDYNYNNDADYSSQSNNCNATIASNIGTLYHLSSAIYVYNNWTAFQSLVNKNKNLLSSESTIIKCMRNAGEKMQNASMQNFDAGAGDRAYEQSISMGATMDMANEIKSNVDQGQIQLYYIGQELVWLSNVLPECANDNWGPFVNTSSYVRKASIEQIQLMSAVLSTMNEQDILNYFYSTMEDSRPYMEYQVAVMVYWFSN